MKNYLALGLLALSSFATNAQSPGQLYFIKNDVKVLVDNVPRVSAWSGGVNSPQFALADLNNDGKKDLVIYEKYVGVKTFINSGVNGNPNYVYDGNYEATFPDIPTLYGYLRLVDYNEDNIPDLFHKGQAGISVNIGYYNSKNQLAFKHYKELYYQFSNGMVNAYVAPDDLPSFVDIDRDGDLDFFAYNVWGNTISFYKNCTKESGLPKDSIKICLKDECWGKSLQNFDRTMVLGHSCVTPTPPAGSGCKGCPAESGNKGTHAGNTICIFDYDGDGDFDMLNGNISFSDIQLMVNGKQDLSYGIDSFIRQDTVWASNGKAMFMPFFPAAFDIDIDQDGDKDLLFSPNAKGFENYKSISYYKNNGTSTPNYFYQSDTFLVNSMIDHGSNSRPVFYDYNKDGKMDMFVGSTGYYQSGTGTFSTAIAYYENISDPNFPTFKRMSNDFMGLSSKNLAGASLSFGDVDNDGIDDMIMGQTDGTILMFKNGAGSNTVTPLWSTTGVVLKNKNSKTIDVGGFAAPIVYDLDTDGKSDLIVGCEAGYLYYFKNIGATGSSVFDSVTNKLGGIRIAQPGYSSTFSIPFIGAIDDTKKEYLLIGSILGDIFQYDGFQNGNTTGPYTLVEETYQGIKPGPHSAPAAIDIDNNGKYELYVGNELGGLMLYRQMFSVGINEFASDKRSIKVFPNPATDAVTIAWDGTFGNANVEVSLISVTGQKLASKTVAASQNSVQIKVSDLPSGIYYCQVQAPGNRVVSPVTIVR